MSDNINNRIEFWINLWEDLISNFLKKSYGLSLYSPHILVEDIITEIEENSFQNLDNRAYFYKKLSFYIDNDIIVKNNFKSSFKILRSIFNSERNHYILETSKKIKNEFQEGLYFNSCLEILNIELSKDEEISINFIDSINYLTQSIIVEFIKKGYVLEDIKKFAENIFSDYKKVSGIVNTNYPHNLDEQKYINENGIFNQSKYDEDIIFLMDKLETKDRIHSFLQYFYKTKEKANYIFVVKGLKGSINIEIGGITLYSLENKRFITSERGINDEDIQGRNNNSSERFIQASVEIEYLSPKSSLINALTKLENALDLISCHFKTKTEIEIDSSNYIIVKNGERIFSSWGLNKRENHIKFRDSLILNDFEKDLNSLNDFSFLWSDKKQHKKGHSKLLNAIHWYSKAEQSIKQEDKMLNYWIAIENLFNLEFDILNDVLNSKKKRKIHLIQEVISSTQIFNYIYDYGWELYRHYENQIANQRFSTAKKLPDEVILKANLAVNAGKTIYLEKFIDSLEEIKEHETDLFILQKIENLISFYKDSKFTKKTIEMQIELIESDVLMIYRFRNLIVHNAHFDNALLPYFVWKIRDYSGTLIRKLIQELSVNDNELSNLMIQLFLNKEHFLLELERGKVNMFEDKK
ncbi:hypothetical protein [Flavobacterium sp. LC2016-01]|uniref:hypothetical protein n=1 Tax=Flavobacterium sp. LC2016-01 TaxID=2675876 RepID=UPI0012BB0960|nr:hypothetical protein [Flavobacterium sp. LC2016-01]MTH14530.1 hypothetical protein [Flavobacterium sp. LC2016-01]